MIWTGKNKMEWHRKFAWLPVELILRDDKTTYPGRYAWLQFVWRRAYGPSECVFEYSDTKPKDYPKELMR